MRRVCLAFVLVAAACVGPTAAAPSGLDGGSLVHTSTLRPRSTVRLLFAGDVMLGRGVAPLAAARDPSTLFGGIRHVVAFADLAVANLESPLTDRPHLAAAGPNALEAAPASAELLAAAGFDAMGVANNHLGDAGPGGVADTLAALEDAGLSALGTGATAAEAFAARIVEVGDLRVAMLAFDATGQGPRAGSPGDGIAWWDEGLARAAVERAAARADLVAVGVHGGTEYVPITDPAMARIGRLLATWGADVVWGHGAHVLQPVRTIDPDGDGRPTVVATSLGNLVFDQHAPGTRRGGLLEVLAGPDGVLAIRVGTAEHADGPVGFRGWRPPRGDAAALAGGWWELARPFDAAPLARPTDLAGFEGDILDAALGDPDGDGRRDLVVAFRRPFRPTSVNVLVPDGMLLDRFGRTAHVGLYRPSDLQPRWVAGTVLRPVAAVAPCDGALALGHSTLDDPTAVVATSVWEWGGFGFTPLGELLGSGEPACADVDGDGRLDPVILGRSSR